MYWHIETDVVCLAILLIITLYIRRNSFPQNFNKNLYIKIIYVTMLTTAIDLVINVMKATDIIRVGRWPYQIIMTFYFVAAPVLSFLWFYFVCLLENPAMRSVNRTVMVTPTVLFLSYIAISVSNPFTGWLFTLDGELLYSRGVLFAGTIALYLAYTFSVVGIVLFSVKKTIGREIRLIMLACPLVISVGVVLQLLNPGIIFVNASYTIVFVILYLYIQNLFIKTDGLTGALNRISGEQKIKRLLLKKCREETSSAFIMFDIDGFKRINDEMGHAYGDTILKKGVEIMAASTPESAIISRFGGDEFVVFIPRIRDLSFLDGMLADIHSRLAEETAYRNDGGGRVKLTFTTGISMFPSCGEDFKTLYEAADKALRQAKREGKNRDGYYCEIENNRP